MNNIFDIPKITQLKTLCQSAQRIVVVSHTNPDGDALGSGLALTLMLRGEGYTNTRFFVPNHYPDFLRWIDYENDIEIFSTNCGEAQAWIAAADLIICVDFNQTSRLERMTGALDMNLHAPRVLIDHHISPGRFDLEFWSTESSSTAFLVYSLIEAWQGTSAITRPMADALYLGMMTDTGSFSFSNLTPELFRAVAVLLEIGIDIPAINRAVYNTQSQDRLKMVGYLICNKLKVIKEKGAAYITLTQQEKDMFNFQVGDAEGVVNIPLTISGVEFSAILIQTKDSIKVSLRSVGDFDVNVLSNKHFNGGGHKNAAGGKFYGTMEQAVETLEQMIWSEL